MALNPSRSVADILREALSNLQEIGRLEVKLAKAELLDELRVVRQAALFVGIGFVGVLFAACFMLLALLYLLTQVMPNWASALIIACVLTVVACLCIAVGMRRFKALHASPVTVESLKKDMQWAKHPSG
jgi:uncharacterized membrane protein YqjE